MRATVIHNIVWAGGMESPNLPTTIVVLKTIFYGDDDIREWLVDNYGNFVDSFVYVENAEVK